LVADAYFSKITSVKPFVNTAYNLKLSDNRAEAVVNYLISNGISASRLEFEGFGLTNPIASNDTEEGRQENRRVEFRIIEN